MYGLANPKPPYYCLPGSAQKISQQAQIVPYYDPLGAAQKVRQLKRVDSGTMQPAEIRFSVQNAIRISSALGAWGLPMVLQLV